MPSKEEILSTIEQMNERDEQTKTPDIVDKLYDGNRECQCCGQQRPEYDSFYQDVRELLHELRDELRADATVNFEWECLQPT